MTPTRFNCDTCGRIGYVLLDGYAVGDRLLEGVMFRIMYNEIGGWTARLHKPDGYTKGLNIPYWEEKMAKYGSKHDFGNCPSCNDDVDMQPPKESK